MKNICFIVIYLIISLGFCNAQNLLPKGNFESKTNSGSCTAEPEDSLYFIYGYAKYWRSSQDSLYKLTSSLKWLDSLWHMTLLDDTSLIQYPLSLAMRLNIRVLFVYDKFIKKFNYPRAYFGRGIMVLDNGLPAKSQSHWTPLDSSMYNLFYYYAHHVTNRVSLRTLQPIDSTLKFIISFTVGNDMQLPYDSFTCANHQTIRCNWKKTDSVVVGLAEHDSTFGTEIYRCLPLRQKWSTHHIIVQPKFVATRLTIGNLGRDTTGETCFDNISMYPLLQSGSRKVCINQLPATLYPVTTGDEYNWPEGIADSTFKAQDTGWYVLRIIQNGKAILDSIFVSIAPSLNLPDTARLCAGDSVKIDATSAHYTLYEWNNGVNEAAFYTNTAGIFTLKASNPFCTVFDTIRVLSLQKPPLHLPLDTSACLGKEIALDAYNPTYQNYVWNTSETGPTIKVNTPGKYVVYASNTFCSTSDSIQVRFFPLPQNVKIVQDTVCFKAKDTCTLSITSDNLKLCIWNNTDTTTHIKVTEKNWNFVRLISEHGCMVSDSILPIEVCDHFLWIPNAFSPNGDGLNDVFLPIAMALEEFKMVVYNRWGEILFETDNITNGWDGNYKGTTCQIDEYIWYIEYKVLNGKRALKAGTVFLMR